MNHRERKERKERMEEVVDSEMADVFVFFALFVVSSTSANKTLENFIMKSLFLFLTSICAWAGPTAEPFLGAATLAH